VTGLSILAWVLFGVTPPDGITTYATIFSLVSQHIR
jgi:hypothetical protein